MEGESAGSGWGLAIHREDWFASSFAEWRQKPARDASSLRQQPLDLTAGQAELVKNLSDWALPGKQWGAPPAMTGGDQAKPVREAPPSFRRGQRDQGNVMDVISHSTADAQARSFVDNWATAEPLSR